VAGLSLRNSAPAFFIAIAISFAVRVSMPALASALTSVSPA